MRRHNDSAATLVSHAFLDLRRYLSSGVQQGSGELLYICEILCINIYPVRKEGGLLQCKIRIYMLTDYVNGYSTVL